MRGQLFSYDLLFASVALVALLTLFLATTSTVAGQIGDAEVRADIGESAQNAANSLLRTPGDPSNWELYTINESGTVGLGLASAPGELDQMKVSAFFALANESADYNASLAVLGLTNQNYRYNASLKALNGTVLSALVAYPTTASAHVASVERFARLNGTVVIFKLVVWDE